MKEWLQKREGLFDKRKNRRGQASVVLMLIIMVALVFYAVSLNLGKVSTSKTNVTVASNTAASLLASQMASYGQKLFKETMGGKFKRCSTNWLGVLGVIIAIVAVIITAGSASPAVAAMFPMAVAGLALSTVSLVLQVTVIQPGLTSMWNKMLSNLTMKDSMLESALQTALFKAVDDAVQVPDLHDLDADFIYGEKDGVYQDYISRLGYYYDKRVRKAIRAVDTSFVEDFLSRLRVFVYGGDLFALSDPGEGLGMCNYDPNTNQNINSFCNPCCQAYKSSNMFYDPTSPVCADPSSLIFDPLDNRCFPFVNFNPEGCDCFKLGRCSEDAEIGVSISCWNPDFNPYVTGNPVNAFIYDRHFQDPENQRLSFLEQYGQDDGHPKYYSTGHAENDIAQTYANGNEFFTVDDATGIFPLMHHFSEWGMSLTNLNPDLGLGEHCYWFDHRYAPGSGCQGKPYLPNMVVDHPLTLPVNPGDLRYETSTSVDSVNANVSGRPPVASDVVIGYDDFRVEQGLSIVPLKAADDSCALNSPDNGLWKRGADRYCSQGDGALGYEAEYPYNANCPRNYTSGKSPSGTKCSEDGIPVDCDCDEVPDEKKVLWHDDSLDDIGMQIRTFIDIAQELFSQTDMRTLVYVFDDWYDELAPWIETPDNHTVYSADFGRPYILYNIRNLVDKLREGLSTYRDAQFASNEAWCVPLNCPECSPQESATFGAGQISNVIACLDYNMNNDTRFEQCGKTCSQADCNNLPRSLIPPRNFDPAAFTAGGNNSDKLKLLNCLDNCSNANCWSTKYGGAIPEKFGDITYCAEYRSKNGKCLEQDEDGNCTKRERIRYCYKTEAVSIDCANWGPGNEWYDKRAGNLVSVNPYCDLRSGNPWASANLAISETGGPTSGWLFKVRHSALEAKNQVAKFRQRRDFLSKVWNDLNATINALTALSDNVTMFLDSPEVQGLINKSKAFMANGSSMLPKNVIYGWRSDPGKYRKNLPADDPKSGKGYWHIVRIDAGFPGNCIGNCGTAENPDGLWPRVKTYTKGFLGITRCYKMQHLTGLIKVRVVRWDEEVDKNALRFPNKVSIWQSKNQHPNVERLANWKTDDISQYLENACPPDSGPSFIPPFDDIYQGAYIVSSPAPNGSEDCVNRSNEFLQRGVMTETCAEYSASYAEDGFNFKFVNCP